MIPRRFPREFYARESLGLARDLLGQILVHADLNGVRRSGRIVETEAYLGVEDPAAHSFGGRRTARNQAMYGEAGRAYVYFIYGMHFCMNVVAASEHEPEAVLIRALEPLDGIAAMTPPRPKSIAKPSSPRVHQLANGPGKLCRALGIERRHDGLDLVSSEVLFIERGGTIPDSEILEGPRVGIDYAADAAEWPLRFGVKGSMALSARRFENP